MSRRSLFPLLLLGITAAGAAPLEPLRVASFSVGQGHSTLLRSGDFAVLIDGSKPSAGPPSWRTSTTGPIVDGGLR